MKKKWIGCICILLATLLSLAFLQELLKPKYMTKAREGALISEYYNEKNPSHDVIFIGDCEVYESFTPPTLWETYGITSYIRGSAQQLAWHSYYLLEDTLQYETPKVVVYNVLALKYGEPQSEAYNRWALDGMKWSSSKLAAIQASMTEDETMASYLFPLLRYHSRWNELCAEDWEYLFHRDIVSHNGYLMQTGVKGGKSQITPEVLEDEHLPERSMAYLERMRMLCEQKGIAFVLIKAPTNDWNYHWYDEWDAEIESYASEHGLRYYNFIDCVDEIGLDWNTDTYDAGVHLNVYGAEKLTDYFGEILMRDLGLRSRAEDAALAELWRGKVAAYYKERNG